MNRGGKKTKSGFSLVELIVTVAVMGIILAVVVFNHSQFSRDIEVTNLAYEVGLSIREAQVYGLSVAGQGVDFNVGYGVHFNLRAQDGKKKFIFFTDDSEEKHGEYQGLNLDCGSYLYTSCISTYEISGANEIYKICWDDGSISCSTDVRSANIVFYRPDPYANFSIHEVVRDIKRVGVCLRSTAEDDRRRVVEINDAGQISVGGSDDLCVD